MHPLRVILDLDHTLLNTTALKAELGLEMAELGVDAETFWNTYAKTVKSVPGQYDYDPARHAGLLASAKGVDAAEAEQRLTAVFDRAEAFLYPDVKPFLEHLRARGYKRTIFTFGNRAIQQRKIDHLHLGELLDSVIVTEQEKRTVALAFEEAERSWIFVNDNANELISLKTLFPAAHFLHLHRPNSRYPKETGDPGTPTAEGLADMQALVDRIAEVSAPASKE
jgi:FMN phosphatase YigB (HAD superfamily)